MDAKLNNKILKYLNIIITNYYAPFEHSEKQCVIVRNNYNLIFKSKILRGSKHSLLPRKSKIFALRTRRIDERMRNIG